MAFFSELLPMIQRVVSGQQQQAVPAQAAQNTAIPNGMGPTSSPVAAMARGVASMRPPQKSSAIPNPQQGGIPKWKNRMEQRRSRVAQNGGVGQGTAVMKPNRAIPEVNPLMKTQGGAVPRPGLGGNAIMSDVNTKESIIGTDDEDVLDKLARVPVFTYNYVEDVRDKIGDDGSTRIGPMAQDFGREFMNDPNATMIPMPLAIGTLFSAVRGLNQKFDRLAGG